MPVRKTESKLPFNLTADDLGQNQPALDGKSVLISFLSSPVVTNRLQQYVIFVIDSDMAAQVHSYEWTFSLDGTITNENSSNGYKDFTPSDTGNLSVTIILKNASDQDIGSVQLNQEVIELNGELEALISLPTTNAPLAGDPETSREIINDYRAYMDELCPRTLDPNASANFLLCGITYQELLQQSLQVRAPELESIAASLDGDDKTEMKDQASYGIGVCRIKPHVLAMYLDDGGSTLLPFTALPEDETERNIARNQLLTDLEANSLEQWIDLFNVLRFPKSNLKMCVRLLEEMKTRYFNGSEFPAIIENRSNCLALINQFKSGPFGNP